MSKYYDIGEVPVGTFPLTFKIIDLYQWKDPGVEVELKCAKYQTGSFPGNRNAVKLTT